MPVSLYIMTAKASKDSGSCTTMQSNIQYNAMLIFFSHLSTLTCWWSYCYIVLVFYQLWVLLLSCIRRRLDVPALSDVTLTEIFLGRFFLLQTMDIIYGVFRCKIFNLFTFSGRWPSLWHWHWGPLLLRQTHGKNLSLSQNTRWGPFHVYAFWSWWWWSSSSSSW